MINKRSIKHMVWMLIISSVLALCPSVSEAAYSGAATTDGRLITGTPFDPKVYATGAFSDSNVVPQSMAQKSAKSVEELFLVAKSFRYVHVAKSRWQTPEETQVRGSGDCADKSVWLYAQLKENGYENVRLVIGKYRQIDALFHVWVVYTDATGKALLLDPAIQKRIWESGRFGEGFYKALYSYDGKSRYRYDF